MSIVAVTRLHVRSVSFFPQFFWYTLKTSRQAKYTPGNRGVRVRRGEGLAFWTLSIWQTIEAMKKFMFALPHKQAMQKLPYWCDEAAFADWEQSAAEFPSWDQAAEKLRATGQLAKVLHPSERQKAGEIVT